MPVFNCIFSQLFHIDVHQHTLQRSPICTYRAKDAAIFSPHSIFRQQGITWSIIWGEAKYRKCIKYAANGIHGSRANSERDPRIRLRRSVSRGLGPICPYLQPICPVQARILGSRTCQPIHVLLNSASRPLSNALGRCCRWTQSTRALGRTPCRLPMM